MKLEKERELELEKIALLSKDEARQIIISELEKTLHFRKAKMIKKYEEEIKKTIQNFIDRATK